jgi:hypothetical protein
MFDEIYEADQTNEIRFRLRVDQQVVGYLKQIGSSNFYSKDCFWWSGAEIQFDQKDQCLFLKDKNNRMLYAMDIIQFSTHPHLHFIIHFDEQLNTMQLIEFETKSIFSNDAWMSLKEAESATWVSYVFIN